MLAGINTALDAVRSVLRSTLLRLTAAALSPPVSFSTYRSRQHSTQTIWMSWNNHYLATKPYLLASITGASPTQLPPDQLDAEFAVSASSSSHYVGDFDIWTRTFDDINDILTRNIASIDDCSTSVRHIKERLDQLAKETYEYFWTYRAHVPAPFHNLRTHVGSQATVFDVSDFWVDMFPQTALRNRPVNSTPLATAYKTFGQLILSDALDASVRRFCVNPGPGSCGMYYHREIAYLHMQPLLPSSNETSIPNAMTTIKPTIFDDDDISGDVNDEYQLHLEERFKRQFATNSSPQHFREALFRSVAPTPRTSQPQTPSPGHRQGPSTHSGPSTSSRRRGNSRRQNTGSTSAPSTSPPQPTPGSTTPAIPDDDDYEPDRQLASLARPFTNLVRSKPPTELFHDHMDRFSTTNEDSVSLTRSQVRTMESGQADFKIQTRVRGVKTDYVITYTRKSRKPVFNRIN